MMTTTSTTTKYKIHKQQINKMTFESGLLATTFAPGFMVIGFLLWDNHWSGSVFALNMYKCNLATLGFVLVVCFSDNNNWNNVTMGNISFLFLSSTIGILIGDFVWLEALRILGAKKVIIMDCLKPFVASIIGNIFFNEQLHLSAYVGLFLTIVGVTMVSLEKKTATTTEESEQKEEETIEDIIPRSSSIEVISTEHDKLLKHNCEENHVTIDRQESYAELRKKGQQSTKTFIYGVINGVLNIILHAVGAALTKQYGQGMTTWQINMIRFGFAGICMAILSSTLSCHQKLSTLLSTKKTQNPVDMSLSSSLRRKTTPWYALPNLTRNSWIHISIGVAFVTFLHPALVYYAMFQIPLALVLTLDSIGPLYSLPFAWMLQKEVPTCKAYLGVFLSIGGIVILSFKGMAQ